MQYRSRGAQGPPGPASRGRGRGRMARWPGGHHLPPPGRRAQCARRSPPSSPATPRPARSLPPNAGFRRPRRARRAGATPNARRSPRGCSVRWRPIREAPAGPHLEDGRPRGSGRLGGGHRGGEDGRDDGGPLRTSPRGRRPPAVSPSLPSRNRGPGRRRPPTAAQGLARRDGRARVRARRRVGRRSAPQPARRSSTRCSRGPASTAGQRTMRSAAPLPAPRRCLRRIADCASAVVHRLGYGAAGSPRPTPRWTRWWPPGCDARPVARR